MAVEMDDAAMEAYLEGTEPDMETFLGLPMAMEASKRGGSMPTVFNAANELAVKKFLNREIRFLDIYDIVCMSGHIGIC